MKQQKQSQRGDRLRLSICMGALALCCGFMDARGQGTEPVKLPVLRTELLSLLQENGKPGAKTGAALKTDKESTLRHDSHREKLRTILRTHGWPATEWVGQDGADAFLLLLEEECTDAALMKTAIPLLYGATLEGKASRSDLARLIDAARVGEGCLQVYGTQYRAALDGKPVRFPLEDIETVDARRRQMGLNTLRDQEIAMGLLAPLPSNRRSASAARSAAVPTRLQMAPGLNTRMSPGLNHIYVHSPDDPRGPGSQRPVTPEKLDAGPKGLNK